MKKVSLYINVIITLLVAAVVWGFWAFCYPAHLHFHEQLQLFEFTQGYFLDTIIKPAGLAEYLSRFIVQFFYNGNLGPAIVALLLALLYNATTLLFPRCEKTSAAGLVLKYSLSLVPVVLVSAFLMNLDAKLTMPVGLTISLYAVWLTERIHSWRISLPMTILMSMLLGFAVGSVFVVYVALVMWRKTVAKIGKREWKLAVVYFFGAFALWAGVMAVLAWYYPYPTGVLALGDYYNRFVFVKAEYNILSWSMTILVGIVFVAVRNHWIGYLAPIAVVVCCWSAKDRYVADEESLLENIYLVRNGQWDDILEKYSKRKPSSEYELTGLNLALAMKGQLADRFFHYPQKGSEGLLPVYKMDYMTPLLSAEAYLQMGMVNTAQRFYYESMEGIADHQKSAFCLQRLVMTALVNGRVNLAKGYLHKLRNTLYYSKWAEQMMQYVENPALIDSHTTLGMLRKLRVKHDSFFIDDNQAPLIAEMLNDNPGNYVGWQYLFTMLMAQGRLDELMQTAAYYTKHFPSEFLPNHVQEALLYHWVSKTNSLNGFPWKVRTEIGQRFMQFAGQANQAREIAEPIVRRDYADTFWCYAVFKAQEVNRQQADGATGASQLQ